MESGSPQLMVYRPRKLRWLLGLALLVLVLVMGSVYRLGHRHGGEDQVYLEGENSRLSSELAESKKRNTGLRERVAILERAAQVDTEAYNQVKDDLLELQDEILSLREELAFYRGIVTPSTQKSGLSIQRLDLESAGKPGHFRFSLLLTQVIGNDRNATGVVHLQVKGLRAGKPATLSLAELTDPSIEELTFKFRYFQTLEGQLKLPLDFTPRTAIIEVKHGPKKKRVTVERTFGWPS